MKDMSKRLPASREVEWGLRFASCVAEERKATQLAIRDVLAGMYLSSVERLGRYWDEWERLEDFLINECDLQKPRLFYWFEMYNLMVSGELPEGLTMFDNESSRILGRAENLAIENGSSEIRLEHFLAAVSECGESEMICQRFVASGMKVGLVQSKMRT